MCARAPNLPQRNATTPMPTADRVSWIVLVGVGVIAGVRLAGLVWDDAVNVPYGDQWDFLTPLFNGQGPWAPFFHQHGPHRQGLGGVAQWLIYRASGWDVRAEAWAGVFALALAAAAMLAVTIRVRGRVRPWDAALPLIILSPVHWETLLLAPNLAHSVLPLALTCGLALVWVAPPTRWRLTGVAVVSTLCLFTGFGFSAAAAALVVALASQSPANPERRAARWIAAAVAAAVGAFLTGYRWDPAVPGWHFPVADWWNYGTFAAYMMATLVGLREHTVFAAVVGGMLAAGVLSVFIASLWQIVTKGATARTSAAALLTGTALAYMAFTAFGRLPVNLEAAFMWRYTSMTMPAVLGLVVFVQPWLEPAAPGLRRTGAVGGVCLLALAIWCNFGPERAAAAIGQAKRDWVRAYLATHDLARANTLSGYWVYPPQPNAPQIAERLRWLEQRQLSFFKP